MVENMLPQTLAPTERDVNIVVEHFSLVTELVDSMLRVW
jgi:hypothetical protein